jgi:3',5'-cyclic AMP phosphodiesterase CpdA
MRTIAHISDIHFGRIDLRVADALAADLAEKKPTLLVASGDFTQRGRRGQYLAAAKFLQRLPSPQLLVPGNHDIPLYDVFHRFFAPLKNYRQYLTGELRPTYRDEEMFVMGINTARSLTFSPGGFWKDGDISEEQLLDVESRMRELPASLLKVVVTHHPFMGSGTLRKHRLVHHAERALGVLQRSGVDLLLAGHFHIGYSGDVRTHFQTIKRSMLSVQAGSATSTRRRESSNTYNWITLERDRISIEVRSFDGNRFGTLRIATFLRGGEIWRLQS